ncbi:MAG: 50S ribosomal protein L6 [Alphaproteobacteria bacterium]|jgi:large subunit ribosomal protein L6
MSRIGKNPVVVPKGVEVTLSGQDISAKGPKGTLAMTLVDDVIATKEDDTIRVAPRNESKRARTMWGMQRSLVDNLVVGVSTGFTKELEIVGVGYRAQTQGKDLVLALGFSHEVRHPIPEGITIECPSPTQIKISGADRQRVGQTAAEIRAYRKPEPFKGKGVKYVGEYIFRKEGKKK